MVQGEIGSSEGSEGCLIEGNLFDSGVGVHFCPKRVDVGIP